MERTAKEMAKMSSTISSRILGVAVFCALVVAMTVQAVPITIDPGTYGSYRADNSLVSAGSYAVWSLSTSSWALWDSAGTQSPDLADGSYEIRARDAGVVIGTITISGGSISSSSGSITAGATSLNFITHDVAVSGAPGWVSNAHLWNLAVTNLDVGRFVMPAGNWTGWYGHVTSGNDYQVNVASDGMVTIGSDARGIGITGGSGQLNFPTTIRSITLSGPATPPPGANFMALDWATVNLPFSGTTTLYLYDGGYNFISGLGNGTWTPAIWVTNDVFVPLSPKQTLSTSFTWHSNESGQDYTYTFFSEGVPEPSTALVLGLGALALRRRRAA